jgi:hypothetical protein
MQLVFAGRIFDPVGVNFCQRNATNQLTCVESPLPSDSPTVELLQNFAVQIRLVDGPRPASIGFTFLNANTLQSVQAESRAGDRLVLFNIRPAPGVYFLRVSVDWNGTNADYFFRVRINP